MSAFLRALAALAMLAVAMSAQATPDAKAQREIDHLLAFVAASDCRFVRSGTEFDGAAARKHLERKLDYARSMLSTADQFVDHVATGSTLTGENYKVRCGTRELASRAWLRGELERFRTTGK